MKKPPGDPGARALREAVSASITPTAWVITALYGLLIAIHPFALPGPDRWTMSVIAAVSACLSAATALLWQRHRRPEHAHAVNAWLASIVLGNTVLHFILFPQAGNTTNFIILILGAGLVMLSRVSFYVIVSLSVAAWAAIVVDFDVVDPTEWGWFLYFAVFVGIILEEQRIHATRASGEREQLLLTRSAALQNLVQTPALADANITPILHLIGESARSHLSASSIDIWVRDNDSDQLKHEVTLGGPSPNPEKTQAQDALILSEGFTKLLLENRTVEGEESVSHGGPEAWNHPGQPTLSVGMISARHIMGVIRVRREPMGSLWTLEDQMFAASIADLANLALQTRQRIILEGRAREAEHLESLGVLAGGVAHDFNNLLAVILGNIELMLEAPESSGETLASLNSMMEAGTRARDLAQQMLAYAGRAHRETHTLNLASFASDIDRGWAHDLLHHIEVSFEIAEGQAFPVDVDPTQIRQVILNLLTNARDAGATQIRISVGEIQSLPGNTANSWTEVSALCWLEVADNGSGMETDEIERIFEPFYTTREMGTGLGLAAALGIMRAHRGTLEVQSTLGDGSRFRMQLPKSTKTLETTPTPVAGELAHVHRQQNVLVVEDESLVAELVREILEQSGRQVTLFDSLAAVEAGLDQVDLESFEFALIDVTLSDGSGLEVAAAARQRRKTLPVILMSGYDARNVLNDQPLKKTVEFLSKPFSRGDLQASIDEAIARAPEH